MKSVTEMSPRPNARITGLIYLLYFLTSICSMFLLGRGQIIVGNALNVISLVIYVAVTLLFYFMFRPVNKTLSFIAAIFSLAGCTVTALVAFNLSSGNLSPLVFFGPYCILLGYLIFRSTFLPRILGVLLMVAGVGWLIFLLPSAVSLTKFIEALGIAAEGLLMLWLLVMGVNVQRWKEQAGAAEI